MEKRPKKGYEKPRNKTVRARLPAKVSVPPLQKYRFDSSAFVEVGGRPRKSRTAISSGGIIIMEEDIVSRSVIVVS